MKKGVHPEYKETTIVCACGNVIHTHSTKENIRIEICSKCHPFYTGKQKLVDSAGMVDRFKKRYAKKKEAKAEAPKQKTEAPEMKPEPEGESKETA